MTPGRSQKLVRPDRLLTIAPTMFAIVVNFEINPDTESEAIAALEANAAGSRTEPGCVKWEWSRNVDEPDKFAIYEVYRDRAAIDFHKSSAHFKEWKSRTPSFQKTKTSGIYEITGADNRP
jgi:quinol monooxygenase YgiN